MVPGAGRTLHLTAVPVGALVAAVVASGLLTEVVRRYAVARAVLDVPNARSLHGSPTPRGGGAAIVLVSLAGIGAGTLFGLVPTDLARALLGGGLLVAAVGWADDRRGLRPAIRAGAHITATVWTLYCLRGSFAGHTGGWQMLLFAGAGIWIAWAINLYNFMDGVDGLAASEAVCVGAVGGALLAMAGRPDLAFPAWLLAAAAVGFLPWNWPPARIFLGDVGSGFLGYGFATISVASDRAGAVAIGTWLLLLGIFVVDASATLLRRLARGERWYEAHRSHAYQREVGVGGSHLRVTARAMLLNAVLAVLAWGAESHSESRAPWLIAGGILLAVVYLAVERRHPMFGAATGRTLT